MGKPSGFRRRNLIGLALGAKMKYGERRVKFRFGNGRFVRPVPEKIERIERQLSPVPPPGRRALSRPGTADHEDFFSWQLASGYIVFLREARVIAVRS